MWVGPRPWSFLGARVLCVGDGGWGLVWLILWVWVWVCGVLVKVSVFFQAVLSLWQGWFFMVGVVTREYGTGRWGPGYADEIFLRSLLGVLALC